MNKKFLLLAGILSVLCANGLTVYADSTVSTNSENLLVNRSTNADGSTNYEISTTNYPTYQGTFIVLLVILTMVFALSLTVYLLVAL